MKTCMDFLQVLFSTKIDWVVLLSFYNNIFMINYDESYLITNLDSEA